MNSTHVVFGVTGALVLVGALLFRPNARADAPRAPMSAEEVLERLPARDAAEQRRVALRQSVAGRPADLRDAVALARLDIEASRKRADPRYLGEAQAALGPWWQQASPPEEVLVLRATIRQSLHDFDGALADLDRVVAVAPGDAQAWITRSVVLSVRGRYDEAKASCQPLRALVPALVFAVCEGSIDALTGGAAAAYDRIDRALAYEAARASAEVRAWAVSSLAEIAARLGRDDVAARLFQQALALDPDDAYALAAYADLLLDDGRPAEVARLLADRTGDDNLLLRLVLAERAAGRPAAGAHAELLASRYDASRLRGDTVHRREQARFELDVRGDATAALQLARANWQVQREPWDARVVLASALTARDPAAASAVLAFVDASRLEDPHVRALGRSLQGAR